MVSHAGRGLARFAHALACAQFFMVETISRSTSPKVLPAVRRTRQRCNGGYAENRALRTRRKCAHLSAQSLNPS
jgi:hypothetical protein